MNQQKIKVTNQQLILDFIHRTKEISRAEIAEKLGLNKATVSSQVTELLDKELLIETRIGASSGGRRPIMLRINAQAGLVIGIEVAINKAICLVTDLDGAIIHEKIWRIDTTDAEFFLETLLTHVHMLIKELPQTTYGVIGIGFAVPGILDNDGHLLLAPNLKWKNIALQAFLRARFTIPVFVLNEANAGAYNERKVGVAINSHNFAYISIDSGIGVGIMLHDELYVGDSGFAGEDGHMIISADGRGCLCGNHGCWETYASGYAITLEAAARHLPQDVDSLYTLALEGNVQAIACFEAVGRYIGIGLSNIAKTLNPEMLVIGGVFNKAEALIAPSIQASLSNHQQWLERKESLLLFSSQQYPAAKGGIRYAIDQFLVIDN